MTYEELKALAESGEPLKGARAKEAMAAIEAGAPPDTEGRWFTYVHYPAIRTVWILSARPVDRSRLVGLKLTG